MNRNIKERESERGSAIVIALLVMALLLVFAALAVSRSASETVAIGNEAAETRTFSAADASLEDMTQQFDGIFDFKLSPSAADLSTIAASRPQGFDTKYGFENTITQIGNSQQIIVPDGDILEGLQSTRDVWNLSTKVTDLTNGTQVVLNRRFNNDRVPIFQFGIFYDDDLEFHPGPRFDFGGRVHSNGNIYLAAGTGLYFSSKVTSQKELITDVGRNGRPWSQWGEKVFVKDAVGAYQPLTHTMGSALNSVVNGPNLMTDPDYPPVFRNAGWAANELLFGKNLLAEQKAINLPLKITVSPGKDYIDLIKRGKNFGDLWNNGAGTVANPSIVPVTVPDDEIVASSRYADKAGIRVSLSDSKAKLPGCADAAGNPVAIVCGVRLDGTDLGGVDRNNANAVVNAEVAAAGDARGYQPRPMNGGQIATRLNGNRFFRGVFGQPNSPQTWIKIETVSLAPGSNQPTTKDITEDILSLGVTEQAPQHCNGDCSDPANRRFRINDPINYYDNGGVDSRSIIKLQRFVMQGVRIDDPTNATNPFLSDITIGTTLYNYVKTNEIATPPVGTNLPVPPFLGDDNGVAAALFGTIPFLGDSNVHKRRASVSLVAPTTDKWIVPFPIEMFDTREGVYNDDLNVNSTYGNDRWVPRNGVMSLIDVDVANLRQLLSGGFNSVMPTNTVYATANGGALRGQDVPSANGWVLYVSDRRGDRDFDGEYDMEDIYGPNDGNLQYGEDVNGSLALEADYQTALNPYGEAPTFLGGTPNNPDGKVAADQAAVLDHTYFRRGVRLINGEILPGIYNSANALNTQGFTVASENAVYVKGNYNARGISLAGTPTSADNYIPKDGDPDEQNKIPASIAADAVTILSNAWTDSNSFRSAYSFGGRVASNTYTRFAMIAGDTKSSKESTPNQGGGDIHLAGGVHNFKRFLENWGSARLNYAGSIINLYNSRQNDGAFKCCVKVYSPPQRDWTFDSSFLNLSRLPPGTPFFQKIGITGFERVNN